MRSVIQKRKLNFIYKVRTQNTLSHFKTGVTTLVLLFWQPYDPPAMGLTYFGKTFFFTFAVHRYSTYTYIL